MSILDSLCRSYQTLFTQNHPGEARLVALHQSGQTGRFLDEYFEHEYAKGQEVLARFSKCASGWQGGRALDFGCGAGGLTLRIAEVCKETVGIDVEQDQIDFALSQAKRLAIQDAQFICYAGPRLPFEDGSFDVIFCIDVIEHLPTPGRFVAEFRRILRPGGQLLLSFGPPWGHAHGKHMWARLPGWWTHLLFPRAVVMRVGGFSEGTTWEELGIHRLTVSFFERVMERSGLRQLWLDERIKSVLRPLKYIPWVRELFISEVIGVYQR